MVGSLADGAKRVGARASETNLRERFFDLLAERSGNGFHRIRQRRVERQTGLHRRSHHVEKLGERALNGFLARVDRAIEHEERRISAEEPKAGYQRQHQAVVETEELPGEEREHAAETSAGEDPQSELRRRRRVPARLGQPSNQRGAPFAADHMLDERKALGLSPERVARLELLELLREQALRRDDREREEEGGHSREQRDQIRKQRAHYASILSIALRQR